MQPISNNTGQGVRQLTMEMVREIETSGRFWSKVDIRGDDECWAWTRAMQRFYSVNTKEQPKPGIIVTSRFFGKPMVLLTSRVAWMLSNNMLIQDGKVAMHTCDNPICCNPSHIKIGTVQENNADKVSKKRSKKSHKLLLGRKLTHDEVVKIKSLLMFGESAASIARLFGVSHQCIIEIKSDRSWKHVHA